MGNPNKKYLDGFRKSKQPHEKAYRKRLSKDKGKGWHGENKRHSSAAKKGWRGRQRN